MRQWWHRRSTAGRLTIIAVAVLVGAWLFWGLVIPREERERLDDGTLIITSYRRIAPRPTEQWIIFPDGGYLTGPLSKSGSRHGQWSQSTSGNNRRIWYWYGDRVSEGRWHELNR